MRRLAEENKELRATLAIMVDLLQKRDDIIDDLRERMTPLEKQREESGNKQSEDSNSSPLVKII